MSTAVDQERQFGAHNYAPLPVTIVRGEGIYLWDDEGRRYLDMLGAYSAVSFGHCHPRLIEALTRQAGTLDILSRVYSNDKLGPFLARACEMTGMDRALPMNTGAEAVETALKAARKWAHKVKGVPDGQAEIIGAEGNFHGRTIAVTGLSTVPQYRDGFGPFPPGFKIVPFGDASALADAITPNTAAFLVEPIQGEGGIIIPPKGYFREVERICRDNNVLLICDEIQTGLGRTGKLLAIEHEGIAPDAITLGKALGGGLVPVSMFLARKEVMDVFNPGDHGSTYGGNPIAAAVGLTALDMLADGRLVRRSAELGDHLKARLQGLNSPAIREVRGRGLFIGIEIEKSAGTATDVVLALLKAGVLTKETHRNTVRMAPPFTIERDEVDLVIERLTQALETLGSKKGTAS
jgi:ornithine--oxo-acid transaminase